METQLQLLYQTASSFVPCVLFKCSFRESPRQDCFCSFSIRAASIDFRHGEIAALCRATVQDEFNYISMRWGPAKGLDLQIR